MSKELLGATRVTERLRAAGRLCEIVTKSVEELHEIDPDLYPEVKAALEALDALATAMQGMQSVVMAKLENMKEEMGG